MKKIITLLCVSMMFSMTSLKVSADNEPSIAANNKAGDINSDGKEFTEEFVLLKTPEGAKADSISEMM